MLPSKDIGHSRLFELSLTYRNGDKLELDKVEGNSLVEVLAKFLLLVVQIEKRHQKKEIIDDDIPF